MQMPPAALGQMVEQLHNNVPDHGVQDFNDEMGNFFRLVIEKLKV